MNNEACSFRPSCCEWSFPSMIWALHRINIRVQQIICHSLPKGLAGLQLTFINPGAYLLNHSIILSSSTLIHAGLNSLLDMYFPTWKGVPLCLDSSDIAHQSFLAGIPTQKAIYSREGQRLGLLILYKQNPVSSSLKMHCQWMAGYITMFAEGVRTWKWLSNPLFHWSPSKGWRFAFRWHSQCYDEWQQLSGNQKLVPPSLICNRCQLEKVA
jgi:hypothetical protein